MEWKMLMDNGKTLTSSGNSYGFQVVGFATPNAKYACATKQFEAKIYSVNKSIILNLCKQNNTINFVCSENLN